MRFGQPETLQKAEATRSYVSRFDSWELVMLLVAGVVLFQLGWTFGRASQNDNRDEANSHQSHGRYPVQVDSK